MMFKRTRHPPVARSEEVGIVAWRRRRLQRAGFDRPLADSLAEDPHADMHALLELVDRGCPPALAARILAPLHPGGEPSP
jgi:hypothetical protein